MLEGWVLVIIGLFFAFFKIGGRGRVIGRDFTLSAGAGILLIVIGAIMLSW